MALTLDDIMAAPEDPGELQQHLLSRGLVAPPPPPEVPQPLIAPAKIEKPLSPVNPHPELAGMTPPNITKGPGAPDWMALESRASGNPVAPMHKETISDAPEIPATPGAEPASPLSIKPMTPPVAPTRAESNAAGKAEFKMNRPVVTAAPGTADFWQQKLSQDEYDKAHPWGSEQSEHPGILGKILHGAGLVGQIAGGAVAPGVVAEIPGSRLNRALREQGEQEQFGSAQNRESENASRDVQQREGEERIKEGEQKLTKEQAEQSLEKDAEGNVTGWKSGDGKLHSLDEEATPQAIKDIAGATQNKPHFEKTENGDIVQITPGKNGEAAQSNVIYKGNPKVETDLTTRTVNGQEHHILVDKKTGADIKDLGSFKTETSPTQALTKMKSDEEMVLGYDKDNKAHLMSRADAKEAGLQHISKAESGALDKATTHHVVLNTLQTQLNNVVGASKALDQGLFQRGIIAQALSHPSNTTIDNAIRASVLAGGSEQTKDYVQAVIALREAGLALPKEITGGSRVSEVQASALWQGMPGATSLDSKYAIKQAKKFQSDIDRLRQRAPEVRGIDVVAPSSEVATKEAGRGGAKGGATAAPSAPPAGKVSVLDPNGQPHFVNENVVDDFLKDPKYKGWTRGAGR